MFNIKNFFKNKGGRHLGFIERKVPYPFRAMRIQLEFTLFPWWKPRFIYFNLSEGARANGDTQWYAHWLWVQISYSRWL